MKTITRIGVFVAAFIFILILSSNLKIWPERGNPAVTLFFFGALLVVSGVVAYIAPGFWFNKEITSKNKLLYTVVPIAVLYLASIATKDGLGLTVASIGTAGIVAFWAWIGWKGIGKAVWDRRDGGKMLLEQDMEREGNLRGTKSWATTEQLLSAIDQAQNGLNIGAGFRWSGQGHVLTVGGTRGGKGVNLVIPALLDSGLRLPDASSFVVLDPKGENLAVTGNYLKRAGYKVHSINPFEIPEIVKFGNARFNPFDLFTANEKGFDKYADMIAYALVPEAQHANDYFDKSARQYLGLYIRHMMTQDDEPKNFRTLYKWVRLAGTDRIALLQSMSKNEAFDGDVKSEAKAIAGQLLNDGGRTVESIYSTLRTYTELFKDPELRESVSASDIDFKTIGTEKTAVFVCVNPGDLARCQAWLRLLFGTVMRSMQRYYNPARRVTLLMDEFPTMGALKEFEIAAGFLAGYNVTLWPVVQDLTQLKNLYPNSWEVFLGNAIVKHYLSIGDNFTADYISKRMPNSLQFLGLDDFKGAAKYSEKPLLTSQQVQTFPDIILEVKGLDRPARLAKEPYFTKPDNGADPNPFR